jgi:hypothetical protein
MLITALFPADMELSGMKAANVFFMYMNYKPWIHKPKYCGWQTYPNGKLHISENPWFAKHCCDVTLKTWV